MDFFKAQLNRIQQQLTGLSATQKMLAGTLVLIMLATLWWWGQYAGQAEMEPLLAQSFSADDISRITSRIRSQGIQYKVSGEQVLVPVDRKFEVLADLGYSQLLPRNTSTGFEEIISKMSNPWAPDSERRAWYNRAKEITLGKIIGAFPSVGSAMVVIDPTDERRVGASVHPSATIYVNMRSGEKPGKQLVNAAADVVAGAVSAIAKQKIKVVVDGVSYSVSDKDQPGGLAGSSDVLDLVQVNERHYANKISEQLSFIKGVMVSVTVDVNIKSMELTRHTPDPNVIQKESSVETETNENTAPPVASGEPGVNANVGANLSGGAGGAGSSTQERQKTNFQIIAGESVERSLTPPGAATVVAAAVAIPQSYFVEIFKQRNRSDKDPDDAVLQPLIAAEMPTIRKYVKACTGLKSDDAVTVGTYIDAPQTVTPPPEVAMTSMTVLLGNHTKEIALGALAMVSLFMASMMVRKSGGNPVPALASVESRSTRAPRRRSRWPPGRIWPGKPAKAGRPWTAWNWTRTPSKPSRFWIRFPAWSIPIRTPPRRWSSGG